MRKANEDTELQRQDKDVFNRQALEDRLHAERTAEERRRWKDWQKDSLKNDYEEQMKRRENLAKMEKEKDRVYANQFRNTVEKYENDHNKILDDRRKKNEEVLHQQETTIIPDLNERRKRDAENTMRRQFESTEKQTLMSELSRLNKKHHAERETGDILKMQMDMKHKRHLTSRKEEESYKNYVDNTINMLGERDKKVAEERKKFRETYAKELESQIKEHIDKEKKTFNEMDQRDLTLNQRGLNAYEANERNPGLFKLPGIDRDDNNRENFARYARNKKSSRMGAEMTLSRPGGFSDTRSIGKPFSNGHAATLPYNQKQMKELPKTSEDYGARGRRSSRDFQPAADIHQNKPHDYNLNNEGAGLSKYRSMVDIHKNNDNFNVDSNKPQHNEIDLVKGRSSNLLSPRPQPNQPEYEPTKRDDDERRGNMTERKSVAFNKYPAPQTTTSPQRNSKVNKLKGAPKSLLDIDNMLNQRVLGAMRAGNLNISKENQIFGQDKSDRFRGYNSNID